MLKVPLINPSREKISIELVSIEILVFIVEINSEKQIFLLNKFSPRDLIARETLEFKSKINSNIEKEKFIAIPNKINLIIKLKGASVWVYVK